MHPSDEHQAGIKQTGARPNLLSSTRRGGGVEDSILARLDSEPGARAGSGARLAWYGTAALIAVGLTATLAWLAAGTDQPALALAGTGPVKVVKPQPVVAPPAPQSEAPPAPARIGNAAVIVDAPAPASPAPAPTPTPEPEPMPTPALAIPAPPPMRVVAPTTPAPAARGSSAPLPAAQRPAPPTRARTPGPRPAPRQATGVARGPGESAVDSDVALISAVIYHANGHASAPDEAPACVDERCRPRPAR